MRHRPGACLRHSVRTGALQRHRIEARWHGNDFNKWVTGEEAKYFINSDDITHLLEDRKTVLIEKGAFVKYNYEKIKNRFSWKKIAEEYINALQTYFNSRVV